MKDHNVLEYMKDHKCCHGIKLNCCSDPQKGGHKRKASYDYTGGGIINN